MNNLKGKFMTETQKDKICEVATRSLVKKVIANVNYENKGEDRRKGERK